MAEQFSWVPLPYCSPPRCPFPIKPLALSACVSPRTIHLRVLDKSPVSGPGRGPPSCNKYIFSASCVSVCVHPQSCPTLCDPMDRGPPRLLCPRNSPGKNTGVGCHFLLQGIFPTQGSNPHLLHWQVDSLPLHHLGSPCISST